MKILLFNFLGPELLLILFFLGLIVPVLLYINTIHISIVVFLLPLLRILGIVGLVCWIIHWTKMSAYRKILLVNPVKLV